MTPMFNPPHPGRILKGALAGKSATETAQHIGLPAPTLSKIVKGQATITLEMSLKLAEAFHTSSDFWYRMQANYDAWQAGRKGRNKVVSLNRSTS